MAAVLHERVIRALEHTNGAGRVRQPATPIAGVVTPALGPMDDDMRSALRERAALIEQRADALVTEAVESSGEWISGLGMEPSDPQLAALWRREARTVAAYRDKYGIAEASGLGPVGDDSRQREDAARTRAAILRAQQIAARAAEPEPTARPVTIAGPRL